MAQNEHKQIMKNLVWGILVGALSYGINFVLTPYITDKLGIEAFGFISLSDTLISYINIISVGLNSFAARYIALHYHNGKIEEANRYYNAVLVSNIILSVIITVISAGMIVNIKYIINVPSQLTNDVQILFVLVLANYFVGLIGTSFSAIIFLKNMTNIISRNKGVSTIVSALMILGLIYFMSVKVYYIAIAHFVAGVFVLITNFYYSRKLIPEIKPNVRNFSFANVKALLSAGLYNSINSLGGTLGSGLDLLITNKFLSNVIMGQISISTQLATILNTVIGMVSNAFQPKQLESFSKNDTDSLVLYLRVGMEACGTIGNVFMFCFVVLGRGFLRLWIPNQNFMEIYWICIIIILGNVFVSVVTPLYYVLTLTLKMNVSCWITVGCGVTNVISMIILLGVTNWGAYVVVGTTAILDLVAVVLFPGLSKKYLKLVNQPFVQVEIRHFITTIICLILGIIISEKNLIAFESWIGFIFYGVLFGVIGILVCFFMQIDQLEKKYIVKSIKRKFIDRRC